MRTHGLGRVGVLTPVKGRIVSAPAAVATNGLILNLDATNRSSYSGTGTTWTDLSASGKNATLGNAVYYSGADSGSLIFPNGSNSTATITSASALTGLTNNITIEAWYQSQGTNFPRILSTGAGSNGFCFGVFSTNTTKFKVTKYSSGSDKFLGTVPNDYNVWHQVVLVYSSTAGIRVYVDGQLSEADATATGNINASSPATINIGVVEGLYHKGLISTIRWYNRVLSDAEILGNYAATSAKYTVNPVTSNLILYYDMTMRSTSIQSAALSISNIAGSSITTTLSNASWTSPYITFNGTNTTGSIADTAALEPTTNSFSFETWVYYSSVGTNSQVIVGKTNGGLTADWGYGIRTNSAGDTYLEVGNGTTSVTSPSYTVTTGQWYQIVGVWTNGASKTIELYVNGSRVGGNTHNFTSVKDTTHSLYLGSFDGGATYGQWFNGRMGVVRYYSKALSSAEVLQNYNNDRGLYGL